MDSKPPLPCLGPAEVALEVGLEEGDVGGLEDGLGGVLEGGPLRADGRVEVALEAPRVVRQRVVRRVGPEVDRVVDEGPVRHAAPARTAREEVVGRPVQLRPVRAHGCRRAVEERRVFHAGFRVESPLGGDVSISSGRGRIWVAGHVLTSQYGNAPV